MSLEREALIKFEEIEKRIHSTNKKTMNNSNEILDLRDFIENTETFNTYDMRNFQHGKRNYGIGAYFDKVNFLCKKNTLVKIKLKVKVRFFSPGPSYTGNFYVMLNAPSINRAIHHETFSFNSEEETTFEFEHAFYPNKEENYSLVRLNTSSNSQSVNVEIVSLSIEITGRNVIILQRNSDFKVYISKDNYYITKNIARGGLYLKTPVSNVDLTSFTEIPNIIPQGNSSYVNSMFPFNYTYIPTFSYNSEENKYYIDNSIDSFIFCNNNGGIIASSIGNPPPSMDLTIWSQRGWIYTLGAPGGGGTTDSFVAFTYSASASGGYYCGISQGGPSGIAHTQLVLNGVKVSGVWVSNAAVFVKNWEDNPSNLFMCVATNDMGENFFFPSSISSYSVALGKGVQTNAYLQPDGSITVYLTWLNTVYKKILIFNSSTGKYELSPTVTEYPDTSEILEGYTTDLFICDINRNWSYQPPTT